MAKKHHHKKKHHKKSTTSETATKQKSNSHKNTVSKKDTGISTTFYVLVFYLFFICGRFYIDRFIEQWSTGISWFDNFNKKLFEFSTQNGRENFFEVKEYTGGIGNWFTTRIMLAPFIYSYTKSKGEGIIKKIAYTILTFITVFLSSIGHIVQFFYAIYNAIKTQESTHIISYLEQLLTIMVIMFIIFSSDSKYNSAILNVVNTASILLIVYFLIRRF